MTVQIDDKEKKLLLACDKMVKKKNVSFALASDGKEIILLLRPRGKDPKAALVKTACGKAAKKNKAKLVTWGEGLFENGKVILKGERGFPAGAKKKIREFAIEFKMKSFVKVICKANGAEEEDNTETAEEAAQAEEAALKQLADSTPPLPDDEEELETLVDELMREERAEMAQGISKMNTALMKAMPSKLKSRLIKQKLAQIEALGDLEGMLPATLQICLDLSSELIDLLGDSGEMPDVLKKATEIRDEAKELLKTENNAMDANQQKLWNKLQSSAHFIAMQIPAFKNHLKTSNNPDLIEIFNSGIVDDTLAFISDLQTSLVEMHKADDRGALLKALPTLQRAQKSYEAVKSTEAFDALANVNPFPIPLPLNTIGSEIQQLLGAM